MSDRSGASGPGVDAATVVEAISPADWERILADGFTAEQVRADIDGFFGEVELGEQMLALAVDRWRSQAGDLGRWPRVLEMGSGLGLVLRAAAAAGMTIEGVEPVGSGFEAVSAGLSALDRLVGPLGAPLHRCRVEELAADPEMVSAFDVVVSTYVLEHVTDLDGVLEAISVLLGPDGVSLHLMPNYAVPLEPHFGIPANRFLAPLAARLFRSRLDARPGLWASLNFVTASQLRASAGRAGLDVAFLGGVGADTVRRLRTDAALRSRHSVIARVADSPFTSSLLWVLDRWPAGLMTPMLAVVTHA